MNSDVGRDAQDMQAVATGDLCCECYVFAILGDRLIFQKCYYDVHGAVKHYGRSFGSAQTLI